MWWDGVVKGPLPDLGGWGEPFLGVQTAKILPKQFYVVALYEAESENLLLCAPQMRPSFVICATIKRHLCLGASSLKSSHNHKDSDQIHP